MTQPLKPKEDYVKELQVAFSRYAKHDYGCRGTARQEDRCSCLLTDIQQTLAELWNNRPPSSTEGAEIGNCPNCPNQGWYTERDRNGDPERVQCRWCYEEPYSKFNIESLKSQISDLSAKLLTMEQNESNALKLGAEFGYKQCEKGHNIQKMFEMLSLFSGEIQ